MEELLAELSTRSSRLAFLAPPTRTLIETTFREGGNPADVRYYMENILPMLEKFNSAGMSPELLALSARIAAMTDQSAVMAEFGLEEYTFLDWLRVGKREEDPTRQLYCTWNMYALLLFNPSNEEQTPPIRAFSVHQKWNGLFHQVNDHQAALEFLEDWLQLSPETYQQADLGLHLEQRFQGVPKEAVLRLMDALADSLAKIGHDEHLILVLQAFLGIEDDLYRDRSALQRYLEQWQERCIRQTTESYEHLPPGVTNTLLHGQFGLAFQIAELIRALSWCLHRRGDSPRGMTLFGAYFGIWPDGLDSLHILLRRMNELGPEEAFKKLGSCTALMKRAGQWNRLVDTFLAAFGSTQQGGEQEGERPQRTPNPRWLTAEGNAAALLFRDLAGEQLDKHPNGTIALFCACAGIHEEDLLQGDSQWTHWLRGVDPLHADPLVLVIAFTCFFTGQFTQLVHVLETWFLVSTEDYFTLENLRATLRGREALAQRGKSLILLWLWMTGLQATDRMFETAGLLESLYPELARSPLAEYGRFWTAIQELPAGVGERTVYAVAQMLTVTGRPEEGVQWLERHLNIAPSDYQPGQGSLPRKLSERRSCSPGAGLDAQVLSLGELLRMAGRPDQAAHLVEACLGVEVATYRDPDELQRRIQNIVQADQGCLLPTLSSAHVEAGHARWAVRLLEALCQLNTARDYDELDWLSRTGEILTPRMPSYSHIMAITIITKLLEALKADGQVEKYQRLLAALDRANFWGELAVRGETVPALDLALHLLEHLEDRDPERSLRFCAEIVAYLRSRTTRPDLSASDRLRLALITAELRRRIIALGHSLIAREPDVQRTETLRRQFLCWDAELGHRLLLERFLFASPAGGSDGAAEPVPTWACPRKLVDASPTANALALGCFDAPESHAGSVARDNNLSLPSIAMKFGGLVESLQQAIEESRLAEVLVSAWGDRKILLRAGFTPAGQLVWTLFTRADDRLGILASGQTPAGQDVRGRIREAVRQHDEALRRAWERLRLTTEWDTLAIRAREGIGYHLANREWDDLPAALQRLDDQFRQSRLIAVREQLWQRFPRLWRTDGQPPDPVDARDWLSFWDELERERIDAPALAVHLDQATSTLLEAVAAAWPLHDLAAALDAAPDHDVLLQVDDVLHSVPLAFLRHGGRFLFERTRSMQAILALSLVEWLRDLDRLASHETLDEPDKVLSLSWFEPADAGARNGAILLHQGHQDLAARSPGTKWYSAADAPEGTHACLARGLDAHRVFRVASICGHGNSDLAGIQLGDGIWDGSSVLSRKGDRWRQRPACDLGGIELLIQVSCSIGRVRQTGLQDVEGFCVELAVHRARSVLAGLWPLHALQAPPFANRVAAHYLRLRSETVREALAEFEALAQNDPQWREEGYRPRYVAHRLAGASLRARAVAAARRQWLADRQLGGRFVGLNTAAAFELYGLG